VEIRRSVVWSMASRKRQRCGQSGRLGHGLVATAASACGAGLCFAGMQHLSSTPLRSLHTHEVSTHIRCKPALPARLQVRRRAGGIETFLYEVAAQASDQVQTGFESGGVSPLVLFAAGLASSVNPCNLAVMPSAVAAVAAVSGDDRRGTLPQAIAFTLGSGVVLALVGLGASFLGAQLLQQESPLQWLFPTIAIVMGLSLLKVLPFELSLPGSGNFSSMVDTVPKEWKGFCLGAASAASTSTCSTPVLVTIVSYITGNVVGPLAAASLFLIYAVGYCAPLAIVSSFTGALPWLQAGSRYGPLLSGGTILAVGVTQLLGQVSGGLSESVSMLLFALTFLVAAALALDGEEAAATPAIQATATPGEVGVYRYKPLAAGAAGGAEQVEIGSDRTEGRRAAAAALCASVVYTAVNRQPEDDFSLEGRKRIIRELAAKSPPLVTALRSGKPVVVEFSALWCPDCLKVAPTMREIEARYGRDVAFVTLDVSFGHPDPEVGASYGPPDAEKQWWTQQFGVSAIPHMAFVRADNTVETAFLGAPPPEILAEQIEALSRRQPLPYSMYDAFQGGQRRLELPPGPAR